LTRKKQINRRYLILAVFVFITNIFAVEKSNIVADFKKNILLADSPVTKIIPNLAQGTFIVIGENHTEFSNHAKELELIEAFFEKNKKMAVGMEMLCRCHQTAIDDYLNSRISEMEFLKHTEYFSEWGYDYQFYKAIVDFAKKNKIALIGLNIKNEIVRNIGYRGLTGISSAEFQEIPDQIDFSNEAYKRSLGDIFLQHNDFQLSQSGNFYFAQLIRDEYMAESAFQYFKRNPDHTLILLAGNGHVEHGFGIPDRLKRRSGKSCKTVLIDAVYEPEAADYFIYTNKMQIKKAPRLNVMLTKTEGKILVTSIPGDTDKEKNPLQVEDEILSINNVQIRSIEDIRLFLYDKSAGEKTRITVIRNQKQIALDLILVESKQDE